MNKNPKQLSKWQLATLSALTVLVVLVIVGLFISAVNRTETLSVPVETIDVS